MCTSKMIKYTCGCKYEMEFEQCAKRQGTNVKCDPITKEFGKDGENYCPKHLVEGDALSENVDDDGEVRG
ncbi:hypothetical protein M011DRAFT_467455 [Sporormia fimetaria CBS 119925]|uniref:Uncharacterized protein n=1 Tax=Sporormia fimetaria CBS 119925 TaxID=1340428 RepID=A0A6A6VBD7_9PLEO|nr:hypothetical protein M011DRAFT_467455 [Sporormia fimetaria CBS 119925]